MKTARINYDEWKSEMIKRYGERENFEFVCPVCKFPQTVKQCEEAGAGRGEIGFSCIGRHVDGSRKAFGNKNNNKNKGPCDYAGGGLFALNPVTVVYKEGDEVSVFDCSKDPFCDDPRFAVSAEKKDEPCKRS